MTARLTSKRVVLLLVLLGAGVLLVTGSRTWLHGSVSDAVLGASAVHGTGSQVAPGVLAAALVGAASAVAAATAGRVVRVIASVAATLAGVLALVLVGIAAADPGAALGRLAAATTGRTGSVPAHGSPTAWVWVAALAALAMTLGGVAALAGGRHWAGLSSRYDAPSPSAGEVTAGAAGPAGATTAGATTAGAAGRSATTVAAEGASATTGAAGDATATTGAAEDASATTGAAEGAATRPARREVSAWDRISRGEDPTDE